MNDDLSNYLVSSLGFKPNKEHPGLERAINAFLGQHLLQKKPIQERAIDVIYDGVDTLIISETAGGKTGAAFIPIAAHLLTKPECVALYIAPTKALLNDLFRRLEAPLNQLGLELKIRHGDFSLSAKATSVRVLLTTPESLDVLLSRNYPLLSKVNYLILDEIHQLYGNPRGEQLLFLIQRLENITNRPLQRVALSATVGSPVEVSKWLCPNREPARIINAPEKREIAGEFNWLSKPS
jgi:ATP-dependent helicase Lhr and Lhr-like helicase